MGRFLIIQTAFIGDVILATPVIEALHRDFPDAQIDFLLRKGNEGLLTGHPYINELIIWDKKAGKYAEMFKVIGIIRKNKYDAVINLQRYFSTGFITTFSGAKQKIGFSKNPLSVFFTKRIAHIIDKTNGHVHEVDRNISLITHLISTKQRILPKLYPSNRDFEKVKVNDSYVTMSPTSVWFTKQYPAERWINLINLLDENIHVFLLGGKADHEACLQIQAKTNHPNVSVMAGNLNFLESAALMKNARMNYVNDSAPMHIASAVDAPVTAIFCSTVPAFGFGPLSSNSKVVETEEKLDCRPCGLHGYKACPKGHFNCSVIAPEKVI